MKRALKVVCASIAVGSCVSDIEPETFAPARSIDINSAGAELAGDDLAAAIAAETGAASDSFTVHGHHIFATFGSSVPENLSLCVGARGVWKGAHCKYEYEAYLTVGECRARTGGWVDGAQILLKISAPRNGEAQGTTYANANLRYVGGCESLACASATAWHLGKKYDAESRCNRRSFE